MTWDDFVAAATTIAYWTALWALVSIPAALILFAIASFFPTRPDRAAAAINAHSPALSDATSRFRNAFAAARERLELGTVRVLLDRKFLRLKRDLSALRKVLDSRLAQITYASKATGGTSLVQLLQNFSQDITRAQDFNEIDDGLVDHSKQLSGARLRVTVLGIFAIIIAAVNAGLLYLFFDTMFEGLTVPFFNIELALVVALLFPLVELGSGIGSELAKEKSDGAGTKLIIYTVVVFVLIALGTFEYVIFHELMSGAFGAQTGFDKNGLSHGLVALFGPALTAVQALAGFGVARNVLVIRELGPIKTIKDHVTQANYFVRSLETRFSQINLAATQARQSVDDFAVQLRGRDEAQQPIASALAEERSKFLSAIDSVNIAGLSQSVDPSRGDVDAVTGYSWALALGVIFSATIFCAVFTPEIERSLGSSHGLALGLAAVASLVPLMVGGSLFDRATSSLGHDLEWRDVFSPRDGAYKVASVITLGLLAVGILWICFDALGFPGIGKSAILLALAAGLCWTSSYIDLMVRGIAFLGTVIGHSIVWFFRTTINLLAKGLVAITAFLTAAFLAVIYILAWPCTLLHKLLFASRKPALQLETAA